MDLNKNHTTDDETDGVVLFQGIAILKVKDGQEYDAAITIRAEGLGNLVRWFGSFEWMGVRPPGDLDHTTATIILSDGRNGTIQVPFAVADDKVINFLGEGLPPGFVYQGEELSEEVHGVAHFPAKPATKTRVAFYYLMSVATVLLVGGAIWMPDYTWQLIATALVAGMISGHFRPNRQTY